MPDGAFACQSPRGRGEQKIKIAFSTIDNCLPLNSNTLPISREPKMTRRRYEYHGHYIIVDYAHDPLRIYVEFEDGTIKRTRNMRSAENAIRRHLIMSTLETETITITQREET